MKNKFILSFIMTVLVFAFSGCTWTSIEKSEVDVADVRIEAPVAASMNTAKITLDAKVEGENQKVSPIVAEVPQPPVVKPYQDHLDGGYMQRGEYNVDGRVEQISVLVDMRDEKVFAIRVTPMSVDPDHLLVQQKFAEDVIKEVTGMKMQDVMRLKSVGGNTVCVEGLRNAVSVIMERSKNSK